LFSFSPPTFSHVPFVGGVVVVVVVSAAVFNLILDSEVLRFQKIFVSSFGVGFQKVLEAFLVSG
jgi:hypothetical protein